MSYKDAFTVATRTWMNFDAKTGTFCIPVRDRLVRAADGKLYLIEEPCEPDEPEFVRPFSHEQAFYWLRYYSWQIERTVIEGGKPESASRTMLADTYPVSEQYSGKAVRASRNAQVHYCKAHEGAAHSDRRSGTARKGRREGRDNDSGGPSELRDLLKTETEAWGDLIRTTGLKAE